MDANPSTLRARSLRQRFAHSRNATTTSASLMTRPVDPKFNLMGRELLTLSTCLNARSFDGNTRTDGGSSTTDFIGEYQPRTSSPNPHPLPIPCRERRSSGGVWPFTERWPVTGGRWHKPESTEFASPESSTPIPVSPPLLQERLPSQMTPTSKTNQSRKNLLVNFKSKSLDLMGTSRVQNLQSRLIKRQLENESSSEASNSAMAPSTHRTAERRRRLFIRKQSNSAPNSFDSNSRSSSTDSQSSIVYRGLESALRTSTLFTWNCESPTSANQQPSFTQLLEDQIKSGPELTRIEHVSDLHYPDADPPCHFCSNQSSLSIHDSNRLKIVSRGRISGRDGSRDGSHPPYINLPSPNFQETAQESSTVFPSTTPTVSGPSSSPAATDVSNKKVTAKKGAGVAFCNHDQNADCDEEQAEPPASVLTRRRALVPAKLPPYSTDSCEDIELCGTDQGETSISCTESDCGGPRTRRSSIVVIPPMQICPGDLLVYSKVLTQRSNHLEWDGSTQSLSGDTDSSNVRKQKNSWSLLKLFDRSSRAKSESLAGLEELLSCLQPSVFCDDQLSRYRGLCWSEFLHLLSHQSGEKAARCIIQDRMHSVSSTTGVPFSSAFPSPGHTSSRSRILQRQVTHTDYSTRIKEWTHEKRARFGLVRTLSDRGLDRKLVNEPTLQKNSTDSYLPEDGLCALSITTTTDNAVLSSSEPPMEGSEEEIGSTATTVQKMEERHKEALWDLFQSECSFLYDHLMVLKNVYMDPLKRIQVEGYAMFAEPDLLFGNLDELCCVTYTFCKEFICLLLNHAHTSGDASTVEILTKLFQQNTKVHTISQAYHRYTLNYINALNYLETLRRHAEFCEFEKWCNRDPRCKKLQLTDLLVAPVQHIMKIPLLLREIETRTTGRQEKETVLKILEKEEASIRELDDKMKWLKNFERLLEIQRSLVWPSVLDLEPKIVVPDFLKAPLAKQPCERLIVSPRRQIVLEGPLNLLDSGRPSDMHVILFDDMLLITRKKKGLGKKKSSLGENWTASCSRSCLAQEVGIWRYIVYKQPLSLDRFFLHEINPAEATAAKLDHGFVIICLNRFQQIIGVHTFQASSEQVRHTWMLKLRDTQDRWKRTLQTTVFRSQRTNSSLSSSNISTMNKNQTSQSECKEEA